MFKRFFNAKGEIDWSIVFVVLMLAIIGLASIYVAATHDATGINVKLMVAMQFIYYVLGVVVVIFIMQFDSEQLWRLAPISLVLGSS
ncbi:Uncharacterised protein [Weissella viridescens]|uniref:Rod shape-determining protein RodA n=1 Tax=Weissella viridescens TaxID=1629 RepID=A0A380P770_WEIVI|nr:Uncharacterised protein [Weissella viridescens]